MANLNLSIKKLLGAINAQGEIKLTHNTKEFVGKEGNIHKMYTLAIATWDPEKGKYKHDEVYKTTSTVRMVLYLRDVWFQLNGWELPTDNEQWNSIRAGLIKDDGRLI